MSVNSEFDDRLGGKLRAVRTPPPAGLWDEIEARLPEEERRRRPIAWWWLSGVAALGLMAVMLRVPDRRDDLGALALDVAPIAAAAPIAPVATTAARPRTSSPQATRTKALTPGQEIAVRRATPTASRPAGGLSPRPRVSASTPTLVSADTNNSILESSESISGLESEPSTFLPNSIAFEASSSPPALADESILLSNALEMASLPYPGLALVESAARGPALDLKSPPVAQIPPRSWRWSVRASAAYLFTVPNESAYENRDLLTLDNSNTYLAEFSGTSRSGTSKAQLASNQAGFPLAYGAYVAATSRRGLRLHMGLASTQTQVSSATVVLASRAVSGRDTTSASTAVMVPRSQINRLGISAGAGYAPRLGRWTPSLTLSGGWVPSRRVTLPSARGGLASADLIPDSELLLRQRVFAKAALGVEYALRPCLDVGVDYSIGGLGSAAGVGLRYSW